LWEDWADEPPGDDAPLDLTWWRRRWPVFRSNPAGTELVIRDIADYRPPLPGRHPG
jgi:hypothetical protein